MSATSKRFYDESVGAEDSRLIRHQLERDITRRYLNDYLPSQGYVLEIGAATGRYTLELAKRGYAVTAVDLSRAMIDECRKRILQEGLGKKVTFLVADARCMDKIPKRTFDAVLLMGPLYHLPLKRDRQVAVREASDRLKPGGILFSALVSRHGIIGHLLKHYPQWIEHHDEVRSVIERGTESERKGRTGWRGYYATLDEIVPLHEEAGFKTLVVAGVEPAISADDDSYNNLEHERRRPWLNLLYELSRERTILASSRHLLYIGTRPED